MLESNMYLRHAIIMLPLKPFYYIKFWGRELYLKIYRKFNAPNNKYNLDLHPYFKRSVCDELVNDSFHGKMDVKNCVVVDIGAAMGDTPLYYTMIGGAKEVHAFEMDNKGLAALKYNVSHNGFSKRIRIYHAKVV